ncbi:MAG: VWA domain-containing protein [Rhodothermales bacterium]|nr:VWA domain-containing protein [Rhodothermales bacterium]
MDAPITFADPAWLWLLLAVPAVLAWEFWRSRQEVGMRYSAVRISSGIPRSIWERLRWLPSILRAAALTLGILALARPQERNVIRELFAEGVDVIMVLDTSTSMRAQDFQPNRFEAAREVGAEFIRGRVSDRIGLVVFAAKAYTQAPLTLDYDFLTQMLGEVEVGVIEDGTAIGTALAMATNRLKDTEAVSKVVILLTDGQNNRGEVDPVTAAEVAATLGVRVYPIGVGAYGEAPFVIDHPFAGRQRRMMRVEIDEDMLRAVAEKTGGRYFRATDKEALREIYSEIGELEKTKIEERTYSDYEERYASFLWPAFALLLLELLLSNTRLRRLP